MKTAKNNKSTSKKKSRIINEREHLMDKLHFEAREAYKLLRTNLLFTLPEKDDCKVIGVTSSIRGEGKSTTSINLAYTLAENGSRVLLIDTDLRLPSVAKKLNCQTGAGFSDYLINAASLEDIVKRIECSKNLRIILSGSIPPNPNELLGSRSAKEKIEELKTMFDYIILDLPPVNIVADALVAKDITDGVLVIVREGYSDRKSLDECIRQVSFLKMNVLGFVLTDSAGSLKQYSKYRYRRNRYYNNYGRYGYSYGYKYGYGYGYQMPKKDEE